MNARAILKYGLVCVTLSAVFPANSIITTLSRNDPTPPYSAYNPFDFLSTSHKEYLKGNSKLDSQKHFCVEILPFYQRASKGKNACGNDAELGDICGRMNMIALLPFNEETTKKTSDQFPIQYTNTNIDLPCGRVFPHVLVNSRNELLSDIQDIVSPEDPTKLPPELKSIQGLLRLQDANATTQNNLGFYLVGMKYKKIGVRFNAEFYIGHGVGFTMQTGIATIDQCMSYTNRTSLASTNPFCENEKVTPTIKEVTDAQWACILGKINKDLMAHLDGIVSSTEINYSLCNFRDTSIEDLYGELYWRYPAQINKDIEGDEYPKFLFIPYFAVGGTYAIAKCKRFNELASLPFGSNGHSAGRFRGGFILDFYDSAEIDFEGGVTVFKGRGFCNVPVPNNDYQSLLYPFTTDITVCPGKNWHLALGMNARHFWYNWNASTHYIYVNHDEDAINVRDTYSMSSATCTTGNHNAFKPEVLVCKSKWSSSVFNFTLGYDISPDFTIGGIIQLPCTSKCAYQPSTFMLSLRITV